MFLWIKKSSGDSRQNADDIRDNDTNEGKTYRISINTSEETRRSRDNKDVIKESGKTRRKEYDLVLIANNCTNNTL